MTTETQDPITTNGLYKYDSVIGLLSPAGPGFSGPVSVTVGPDGMPVSYTHLTLPTTPYV